MQSCNALAIEAISIIQAYIAQLGFHPSIHFELEGCYQPTKGKSFSLNYNLINKQLAYLDIDGELVPEYWQCQWEYVSKMNHQQPLKEANNLTRAIANIPYLLSLQGIERTLIKPVVWSGDKGKLALGCHNIFTNDNRAVHIPNAIQMNVSATNQAGENIIANNYFGEYLQQCFMKTSLACCLLYLPEEEAFERLALKERYGLAQELCSPIDISGGHQGSIALYKELGKHNQKMGEQPLLFNKFNEVMVSEIDWKKTARIEHRLGAASLDYNAYVNVIYGLLNLVDAIEVYSEGKCQSLLNKEQPDVDLPKSLYDNASGCGAISLFEQDTWFSHAINAIQEKMLIGANMKFQRSDKLGEQLKKFIIKQYQKDTLLTSVHYNH
ncbi:MAG: hypothetical protein ACI9LM_001347 [Alteromonadaceae bacterium]|jgi:hypothetical protein